MNLDANQIGVLLEGLSGGNISKEIERQEKREQLNTIRNSRLPIKLGYRHDTQRYIQILKMLGIEIVDTYDDLFYTVNLPEGWKTEYTDHSMWNNLVDDKGRVRASFFYKGVFYDRDAFINFNRRFSISYEIADYNKKEFEQQPEYIQDGFQTVLEPIKFGNKKSRKRNDGMNIIEVDGYEYLVGEGYEDLIIRHKEVNKPKYIKNPEYKPLTGYEKYSQPFHYEVHDYDGTILFKSDIVKTKYDYEKDKHREFFSHRDDLENKAKQQCRNWLDTNFPEWEDILKYWD